LRCLRWDAFACQRLMVPGLVPDDRVEDPRCLRRAQRHCAQPHRSVFVVCMPMHGMRAENSWPFYCWRASCAFARVCQDLRSAHSCQRRARSPTLAGDRHCTVTVASTTACGRCHPRLTRMARPKRHAWHTGQRRVMAARPPFIEMRPVPDAGRRVSTRRTSETCARRTPWSPGSMGLHVLRFLPERGVTPMARAAPASSATSAQTG
jgi:hypothetical protein